MPAPLTDAIAALSLVNTALTDAAGIGLLNASAAVRTKGEDWPDAVNRSVSGASLSFASAPALIVSGNVALPTPATVADAACDPATVPGIHCAADCPLASVLAEAGLIVPEPVDQVRATPGTAFPLASRTLVTSVIGVVTPAAIVAFAPLTGETTEGGPIFGPSPPPQAATKADAETVTTDKDRRARRMRIFLE